MNQREKLISNLVGELTPKPRQLPILALALSWWVGSWAYIVIVTFAFGDLRHSAEDQILGHQQFQLESLVGVLASLLITLAAWYTAVPGALSKRLLSLSIGVVALWCSFYFWGLHQPALEASMQGKRAHCYAEVLLYSFLPTLFACFYLLKRYPLKPIQSGILIGVSAGLMPALLMQFACMYVPSHILRFHIAPGILNAGVGVLLFMLIRKLKDWNPPKPV